MTMTDYGSPQGIGGGRGPDISLQGVETNGRLLIQAVYNLGNILSALLPRTVGSATLSASATTTITEPAVTASSYIDWIPTNAAAGSLMGSGRNPYLSAKTAGASFALTTANGAAAGGNETIMYVVVNTV